MPANGWWHEWTFNYDVKVDNSELHLDIAEREAKILVYRGDNWQPAASATESPPADQPNDASQKQQPDPSKNPNPQSTQSETPSQ